MRAHIDIYLLCNTCQCVHVMGVLIKVLKVIYNNVIAVVKIWRTNGSESLLDWLYDDDGRVCVCVCVHNVLLYTVSGSDIFVQVHNIISTNVIIGIMIRYTRRARTCVFSRSVGGVRPLPRTYMYILFQSHHSDYKNLFTHVHKIIYYIL